MKLHEKLQALVEANKLTKEEITEISNMVDVIKSSTIEKQKADFDAKIQEIESKNKDLTIKLGDYTKADRKKKVTGLAKDLTDTDEKLSDAIKLADLTDEDDDATIVSKITDVIKSRKHLQKVETGINLEVKTGEVKEIVEEQPKNQYSRETTFRK